jgi:hypothetical protein
MADMKPFYLVLRDDDERLKRHLSYRIASEEAVRLAKQHPEHAFVVLQTTEVVGPIMPTVKPRRLMPQDAPDEIPF